MQQTVNARADSDVAAMSIEGINDSRSRKKCAQWRKREHRTQHPNRDLAALVQQFFQRIRAEIIRQRRNDQQPNSNANKNSECEKFAAENFDQRAQKFLRKSNPE